MTTGAATFSGTKRYAVRRLLGAGAVGMVYEGYDRERKSVVALKTLEMMSPSGLYRFKQEFRSLAEISHSNVANLFELVHEDDTWFIAMELVQGVSFFHYIRGQDAQGPIESTTFLSQDGLNERIAKDLEEPKMELGPASLPVYLDRLHTALVQLLQGVNALHQAGKMHRDIKPTNVLVTHEGRVVLVDFGLVYDTERTSSELSRVERIVGTAAFMAPEQAMSVQPTPASDMYSVGVMLYQALTGRLPFEGSLVDILMDKQVQDPGPPSTIVKGVPPELDELCVDLLRRNPAARPTAEEALERLGINERGSKPVRGERRKTFMGRDAELQVLEDAWTTVRNGRCVTILVQGPSGIGKSALVRTFLGQVKRFEEVTILRGRCFERESVPFKAFDAMMDGLRRKLKRMTPDERAEVLPMDCWALARVFPTLKSVIAEADPSLTQAHPAEIRSMAMQASRDVIRNLARQAPVVVFLDDVQWGDLDSARMLSSWLSALSRSRLMVVLAFRDEDEESSPFLQAYRRDPAFLRGEVREVKLGPLPESLAHEVARRELGYRFPKVERAASWVARESRGHPHLISELVEGLHTEVKAGREPSLDRTSLGDVLLSRYRDMDDKSQALLRAIAVAGRPLPVRVLGRAAGIGDEYASALEQLKVEKLVRTHQTPAGELVELYHNRVGEAILSAVSDGQRARLHIALAQTMERASWSDAEALMQHFLAGGDRETAGFYAIKAAEQALDALAFDKAAELFRTALALGQIRGKERFEVELKLADALGFAGRGQEAAKQYLSLEPPPGADEQKSLLRRKAAEQYLYNGYFVEGNQLVDETLHEVGLARIPPGFIGNLKHLWLRIRLWFRGQRYLPVKDEQVPGEVRKKNDVAWFAAVAYQLIDPYQGTFFHSVALLSAYKSANPYRVVRSLCIENVLAVAAGKYTWEEWRRNLQDLRTSVGKVGHNHTSGLLSLSEGMAAYLQGHFKHGYRVLRQAERAFVNQAAVGLFELAMARVFLVRCLIYTGDIKQAAELRSWMVADAEERGNLLVLTGLLSDISAFVELAADQPKEVAKGIKRLHEHWEGGDYSYLGYFLWRGDVYRLLYEGRPGRAQLSMDFAGSMYESGYLSRTVFQKVTHEFTRAQVLVARAKAGDRSTLSEARRIGRWLARKEKLQRCALPLGLLIEGACLAVDGNASAASDKLVEAQRAFDRLDMLLYASACRWNIGLLAGEDDEGPNLATAGGWLRHQGVRDPAKFCAMLVPGIADIAPES